MSRNVRTYLAVDITVRVAGEVKYPLQKVPWHSNRRNGTTQLPDLNLGVALPICRGVIESPPSTMRSVPEEQKSIVVLP